MYIKCTIQVGWTVWYIVHAFAYCLASICRRIISFLMECSGAELESPYKTPNLEEDTDRQTDSHGRI